MSWQRTLIDRWRDTWHLPACDHPLWSLKHSRIGSHPLSLRADLIFSGPRGTVPVVTWNPDGDAKIHAMGPAAAVIAALAVVSAALNSHVDCYSAATDASSRGAAEWREFRPPGKVRQCDKCLSAFPVPKAASCYCLHIGNSVAWSIASAIARLRSDVEVSPHDDCAFAPTAVRWEKRMCPANKTTERQQHRPVGTHP